MQSFQRSESSSVSIILFSYGLFAEAIVPITLYNATIATLQGPPYNPATVHERSNVALVISEGFPFSKMSNAT